LIAAPPNVDESEISREHEVFTRNDGLVIIAGGKLTTYRRMAVDTVDVVMEQLDRRSRSITRRLRLHGAEGYDDLTDDAAPRLGVTAEMLHHLANRHGSDARVLAAMISRDPSLGEPLVGGLPHLRAEALHAVRDEMARTLDDVLTRRVPARWLDAAASAAAADDVAGLIAPELGWDDAETARQVASYRAAVATDVATAGLAAHA
jgi:glycerol-3-phosphate dehydrogenase